MRYVVLAFAASLCVPASAQTTPGDVFPLDEGNRWVYVQSEGRFSPSTGSSSSVVGSEEWRVQGTAEVGGETLPLLRITPTPGTTTQVCAVGTEQDGDIVSFPFLDPQTGADCGYALNYFDGTDVRSGIRVDVSDTTPEAFAVGGRSYGERPAHYANFYPPGSMESGFYRVSLGVGVVSVSTVDDFGPGSSNTYMGLRRAEIGGEVFGAPLDPGDGFFPFGVGDAWTFEAERLVAPETYEPDGFVLWGVVDTATGPALRVERVVDGERTLLGECAMSTTPATAMNGFRLTMRLVDTPSETCPSDRGDALPALDVRGLIGQAVPSAGVSVPAFVETTVMVGADMVDTDVASGQSTFGTPNSSFSSAWQTARGLGVVSFRFRQAAQDFTGSRATATYVRVGGVEYGVNPVAGETGPNASALALAVGPNPARASARLFIGGDARTVRVTVLDALGRIVETRDAAAGTLTLDTSRWAAGVYTVRAESADGPGAPGWGHVARARLTVAR